MRKLKRTVQRKEKERRGLKKIAACTAIAMAILIGSLGPIATSHAGADGLVVPRQTYEDDEANTRCKDYAAYLSRDRDTHKTIYNIGRSGEAILNTTTYAWKKDISRTLYYSFKSVRYTVNVLRDITPDCPIVIAVLSGDEELIFEVFLALHASEINPELAAEIDSSPYSFTAWFNWWYEASNYTLVNPDFPFMDPSKDKYSWVLGEEPSSLTILFEQQRIRREERDRMWAEWTENALQSLNMHRAVTNLEEEIYRIENGWGIELTEDLIGVWLTSCDIREAEEARLAELERELEEARLALAASETPTEEYINAYMQARLEAERLRDKVNGSDNSYVSTYCEPGDTIHTDCELGVPWTGDGVQEDTSTSSNFNNWNDEPSNTIYTDCEPGIPWTGDGVQEDTSTSSTFNNWNDEPADTIYTDCEPGVPWTGDRDQEDTSTSSTFNNWNDEPGDTIYTDCDPGIPWTGDRDQEDTSTSSTFNNWNDEPADSIYTDCDPGIPWTEDRDQEDTSTSSTFNNWNDEPADTLEIPAPPPADNSSNGECPIGEIPPPPPPSPPESPPEVPEGTVHSGNPEPSKDTADHGGGNQDMTE